MTKLVIEKDPIKTLTTLEKAVKNKISRNALKQAVKPQQRDIKSIAPKRTGALRVSIGNKVKTARQSQVTYAVLGAKRSYSRPTPGRKQLRQKTESQATGVSSKRGLFSSIFAKIAKGFFKPKKRDYKKIVPANYLGLVDKGTRYFKGRGFMKKSFNQQRFNQIISDELSKGIEKVLTNET